MLQDGGYSGVRRRWSRLGRTWCLLCAGFEKRFEEAREKSKAANKKSAQGGLKFEAEATGWLQVQEGDSMGELNRGGGGPIS